MLQNVEQLCKQKIKHKSCAIDLAIQCLIDKIKKKNKRPKKKKIKKNKAKKKINRKPT